MMRPIDRFQKYDLTKEARESDIVVARWFPKYGATGRRSWKSPHEAWSLFLKQYVKPDWPAERWITIDEWETNPLDSIRTWLEWDKKSAQSVWVGWLRDGLPEDVTNKEVVMWAVEDWIVQPQHPIVEEYTINRMRKMQRPKPDDAQWLAIHRWSGEYRTWRTKRPCVDAEYRTSPGFMWMSPEETHKAIDNHWTDAEVAATLTARLKEQWDELRPQVDSHIDARKEVTV